MRKRRKCTISSDSRRSTREPARTASRAGGNPYGSAYGNPFGGSGNNGGYHEFHFEGNADDMFGDFFDQMFHGKSRGFGSERYTRSGSSRHPFEDAFSGRGTAEDLDLHAEVSIRLEEAASGCEKQITAEPGWNDQYAAG